jgi:integrase
MGGMRYVSLWNIEPHKILARRELAAVLTDLKRRSKRSLRARLSLTIVRLACCCGLRVSEIAGLALQNVVTTPWRPHVAVQSELGKGGRGRVVPLWWDAGTLEDLAAWKAERQSHGAGETDLFVCSMQGRRKETPLSRQALRQRFRSACAVLGKQRLATLTIHHGRHTFVSYALAGGRTLAEVRDAAGHANVWITSAYLHLAVDDDCKVGRLFDYSSPPATSLQS